MTNTEKIAPEDGGPVRAPQLGTKPPATTYGRVAMVGVIWSLLGRGMSELVSIPASMIVARLLTPQDFGIAAAVNFFVQIAQRLTDFGFSSALVQRKELTRLHTTTVFVVNVSFGVALWALLAASAPWLGGVFNSPEVSAVLPFAASSFAIRALGSVSQALMLRNLRFRASALLLGLHTWLMAASSVWFAWQGFGYWSLIWSQIFATAVQTAVRVLVGGWRPSWAFSWPSLRELFSFGIGIHFKRLFESVSLNVDNLIVARALGLAELGYYDKAFTMMNRAVLLLSSAAPAISLPIFAILHGDGTRFRLAYRKVLLASTFVSYSALAGLIAVAPELFLLLFGPQWASAVVPFQVLCVSGVLKTLMALVSTIAQSAGQVWGEVRRQGIYLGLIVCGAGVGSLWGLTGAAIGVLAATSVMTVLMHQFLQRVTALSWRDLIEPQIPAIVCATGLLSILTLLRTATPTRPDEIYGAVQYLAMALAAWSLFGVVFIRFSGFRELRLVIGEIVSDLLPGLASFVRSKNVPATTPVDSANPRDLLD